MDAPQIIRAGDKFALMAASTEICDLGPSPIQVDDELWVSGHSVVSFSGDWQEWIGSVRTERLQDANLVVTARRASIAPSVLDDENLKLGLLVDRYFRGLLLAARFSSEGIIRLTGANIESSPEVREVGDVPALPLLPGLFHENISIPQLRNAAALGSAMAQMATTGSFPRFFRIVRIFGDSRSNSDALEQIHQFSRCVEGLIIPGPGESGKRFKSRTELFIGPGTTT
jgi:hypothetical protein